MSRSSWRTAVSRPDQAEGGIPVKIWRGEGAGIVVNSPWRTGVEGERWKVASCGRA